ncbi:MAG: alpha-amylase family glycosyl hydrolase [Planctomycetota bacterium]
MAAWPKHPIIYEINTWVWLQELSQERGRKVTLANVPPEQWDSVAELGLDGVWLMGVWERSPASIRISMANAALVADFRRAVPDFTPEDNMGSPYSVRRYSVDERLGGPSGLASARRELARRGLRLILDYVPNHVATDHPWAVEHPEYFVHGSEEDHLRDPAEYTRVNEHIMACGKDPYFPAWRDVLQLNAFHPGLRQAAAETVSEIASQCDGMRCDMAMLVMNAIFERTWGRRLGGRHLGDQHVGPRPDQEFWPELIGHVKARHPETLFIAEAYWDLEWELQQQGFDYCYDKRLYDRLEHESAESIRLHLTADLGYQEKLVRFIENHDERRAAEVFPEARGRAAAVVSLSLPGAKLLHEGQLEGRKTRLPVFLARRPHEPADEALHAFYKKLLRAIRAKIFRDGKWQLCEHTGWPDNQSHQNLLSWCWRKGRERRLIAVNLHPHRSQGRLQVPWHDLGGRRWRLRGVLSGEVFERSGREMLDPGLFVDLEGWGVHFFDCTPI